MNINFYYFNCFQLLADIVGSHYSSAGIGRAEDSVQRDLPNRSSFGDAVREHSGTRTATREQTRKESDSAQHSPGRRLEVNQINPRRLCSQSIPNDDNRKYNNSVRLQSNDACYLKYIEDFKIFVFLSIYFERVLLPYLLPSLPGSPNRLSSSY